MKNKYGVKVTDDWAEDFASRSGISIRKAKLLLSLVVGFDNIVYTIPNLFKKKMKKPTLEDILDKANGSNPHPVQIPDEQGKERNGNYRDPEWRNTKIISGFPAIGKSYLTQNTELTVLDSDSSSFSWIREGERNPDFPHNYIQHINYNIGKADYILVSSHDIVRNALEENSIEYTLIYPSKELKDEYLERYRNRGNDEKFISFINSNWEKFIDDIENETFPLLVKLKSGEFLGDVIHNKTGDLS